MGFLVASSEVFFAIFGTFTKHFKIKNNRTKESLITYILFKAILLASSPIWYKFSITIDFPHFPDKHYIIHQ